MTSDDRQVNPPCQSHCCFLVSEMEEMRVESDMKGKHDGNMSLHLAGLIRVTAG